MKWRKFAYKKRTDNQTVQRLRPLYPLWILEGVGQYKVKPIYGSSVDYTGCDTFWCLTPLTVGGGRVIK